MKRSFRTAAIALLGVTLLAGACGTSSNKSASTATTLATTDISIGAQDFGESKILAEIYKQGLAARGYMTSIQTLGGYRPLELTAFDKKTINFAPEYAASMLEFLNNKKGEATSDVEATVGKLQSRLADKGLTALAASKAVDTNAFVVTKANSDSWGIKSLSDLAGKGKDFKIGAPADCQTNPFCIPGLESKYALDLSSHFQALEAGQIADALDAGTIDVALLFSTDGRIKAKNYVLLTDDKHMLAADNVLPVVTQGLGGNADLAKAADAITAKLTTDQLIAMNKRFDIDKEDAAVIAKDFLTQNKLI